MNVFVHVCVKNRKCVGLFVAIPNNSDDPLIQYVYPKIPDSVNQIDVYAELYVLTEILKYIKGEQIQIYTNCKYILSLLRFSNKLYDECKRMNVKISRPKNMKMYAMVSKNCRLTLTKIM